MTLYGVPGTMTRRLLGVVIGTQGLAVFFGALVARALAAAQGSATSSLFLLIGSAIAVLCIADAALLRRPWGVTVGWALQVATVALALVVPVMLLVGLLFGALWLTALLQGRGMDEHTRLVDAQWYATHEVSMTGTPVPGASVPGASVPRASVPGISVPGASVPRASVPGISVPGTSASGTSEPESSAPGTSEPETPAPETPPAQR